MAKTNELKKSPFMGQKKEESSRQLLERAVSRERLFLFQRVLQNGVKGPLSPTLSHSHSHTHTYTHTLTA